MSQKINFSITASTMNKGEKITAKVHEMGLSMKDVSGIHVSTTFPKNYLELSFTEQIHCEAHREVELTLKD